MDDGGGGYCSSRVVEGNDRRARVETMACGEVLKIVGVEKGQRDTTHRRRPNDIHIRCHNLTVAARESKREAWSTAALGGLDRACSREARLLSIRSDERVPVSDLFLPRT